MRKPQFNTSCKIGTMPALVRKHDTDKVEVGRLVRIQRQQGAKWEALLVTKVNPDGYFFADAWLSEVPAGGSQPAMGSFEYQESNDTD